MAIARAFCLALCLFGVVVPVPSQQAQGTASTSRPVQASADEPTVSLTFAGGTLTQFLAQLQKTPPDGVSQPGGLNILAPALADDIELPRIELVRAPLIEALKSVAQIVPSGFVVETARSYTVSGSPVYTVCAR